MMKKITQILVLTISIQLFSQCNIIEVKPVKASETTTFRVEKNNAQCPDCYQWTLLSNSAKIEGNNTKNSVKIKTFSDGNSTLSLLVLTSNGIEECNKTIEALTEITEENHLNEEENCDIPSMKFSEVKYDNGKVLVLPDSQNINFKYNWMVTYNDDTRTESKDRISQFYYDKERLIDKIQLTISTRKCVKINNKTYSTDFWN
ncbi:hypothetical protein [Chryseobacterium sp. T1]